MARYMYVFQGQIYSVLVIYSASCLLNQSIPDRPTTNFMLNTESSLELKSVPPKKSTIGIPQPTIVWT
jgi:hypothetical protein